MARPTGVFFDYSKNLSGNLSTPTPLKVIVGNSATLIIGDSMRVNTSGFAVCSAAGDAVLGILVGLIDNDGIPVLGFGYTGDTGHTKTDDMTVVTSATNQTRARKVYAEILVGLPDILFYNDASANLAQTNLFQFFDHDADANQIDQATASDTSGQFQLIQLDPDNDGDLSKGLFRVAEPQLMYYHGNSTAVNEA